MRAQIPPCEGAVLGVTLGHARTFVIVDIMNLICFDRSAAASGNQSTVADCCYYVEAEKYKTLDGADSLWLAVIKCRAGKSSFLFFLKRTIWKSPKFGLLGFKKPEIWKSPKFGFLIFFTIFSQKTVKFKLFSS